MSVGNFLLHVVNEAFGSRMNFCAFLPASSQLLCCILTRLRLMKIRPPLVQYPAILPSLIYNICHMRSALLRIVTKLCIFFVGNSVTLQLIRRNQQCNVTEALAPVDINLQYDFDFQQFTFLPREVQVLPVSTSESSEQLMQPMCI